MRRAFYALSRDRQAAFRQAVSAVRRGRAPDGIERAWAELGILGDVARTHTLDLYDRAEDLLALMPPRDRWLVERPLFGGPRA